MKGPGALVLGAHEGPQDLAGFEIERVEHAALADDRVTVRIASEIGDRRTLVSRQCSDFHAL